MPKQKLNSEIISTDDQSNSGGDAISQVLTDNAQVQSKQIQYSLETKSLTVKEIIFHIQNHKGLYPAAQSFYKCNLENLLLKHFILRNETTQNKLLHINKSKIIFELLWTLSPGEINTIFGEALDQPLSNQKWEFYASPSTFEILNREISLNSINLLHSNSYSQEAKIKCIRASAETSNNNQDNFVVISSRTYGQRSKETPTLEAIPSSISMMMVQRKQNELAHDQQNKNQNVNKRKKPYCTAAEKRLNSITVKKLINHIKHSSDMNIAAATLQMGLSTFEQFLLDKFILKDEASKKCIVHGNRSSMIFELLLNLPKAQLKFMFDSAYNQPIGENEWEFHSDKNNFEVFNNENKHSVDSSFTIKCRKTNSNPNAQISKATQGEFFSITYAPNRSIPPRKPKHSISPPMSASNPPVIGTDPERCPQTPSSPPTNDLNESSDLSLNVPEVVHLF